MEGEGVVCWEGGGGRGELINGGIGRGGAEGMQWECK